MIEESMITNVLFFKYNLWMKEYAFRMDRWLKGEKMGPVRIDAELHRRCNLNCTVCSRRASNQEDSKNIELSKEKWVNIAKESGELGVKYWNIAGVSEPMCRPDTTLSVMEMIKAYDMFGELTTNGTLWKEQDIKRAVKVGWDNICISIDAPDAKTHDKLRGVRGTFKKATSTVKSFNSWKNKLNSEDPSLTLNVVLNKLNYRSLPNMIKLANELGAQALFVEPMIAYTKTGEKLKLEKQEILELPNIIAQTKDLGKKYGILPTITCLDEDKKFQSSLVSKTSNIKKVLEEDTKKFSNPLLSIPCYYPWFYLIIKADGSVTHCGEYDNTKENIRKKSLTDIWFGKELEQLRKQFVNKKLPNYCEKCRPNVIGDMRMIRKGITKYRNIPRLHEEIISLLKENMELKKQINVIKKENKLVGKCDSEITCDHEKELIKLQNSLTFKISEKISNTKLAKLAKNLLKK